MGKWYCFFSAQYLPTMGGVERYTHNLARKLIAKGNRVTVVTSNTQGLPAHEVSEGIEIYRLPSFGFLNGRLPVLKPGPSFFRQLRELRQAVKPDFIIVQTRFYFLSLYGARFAKHCGVPCIVLDHSTGHLSFGNPLINKMGEWYEHFLTSRIKRACQSFHGVSKACNEWLRHFHIEAGAPVYNAIDLDGIDQLLRRPADDYRKLCGLPEDALVVSFAGRLVAEKGILPLIEAVTRVREGFEKLHLLVVGAGPLEKEVRSRENDFIHFLGRFDFPQVIALLCQSDIFCLPTEYAEGFPTTILEAAACRCFTIATDRGGSRELIRDDTYGLILPDSNVSRLCEAIRRALSDPAYRKSAAEEARRRLEANFTWDIISERVIALAEEKTAQKAKAKEECA